MVFHPDFPKDNRFFLYYVVRSFSGQVVRISQWKAGSRKKVKSGTEKVIMEIPQPFFNHNGGQVTVYI